MSNGLSQAEIDALLQGGADSADDSASQPVIPDESGNAMTQEEIEAMLEKVGAPAEDTDVAESEIPDVSDLLSGVEIDALGEIGNISMGTAATTLFSLLNHKVDITTPRVSVTTMGEMARQYPMPFVSVEVQYTVGLEGINCLFLHENDVKIITDLMLGGDGTNIPEELNEMHLSCISEVMNQMVGASSTSLAQMLQTPIDISPPRAMQVRLGANGMGYPFDQVTQPVVRIGFDMVVEGLINSEIMQVMPVDFAKEMVYKIMGMGSPSASDSAAAETPPAPAPQPASAPPSAAPAYQAPPMPQQPDPMYQQPMPQPDPMYQQPMPQQQGGYPYPQQPYPMPGAYPAYPQQPYPYPAPMPQAAPQHPVDVRPANFSSFGDPSAAGGLGENMDILLDVPLSVTVELGKSRKYIKEILDFNIGTIVVLDKMAGDLVDVVVNGKLIAQGEVVIIDDNYGCRITDIVSPSKRINPAK